MDLFPLPSLSKRDQQWAIIRLGILLFILMLVLEVRYSWVMLIFLILFYYIEMSTPENFCNLPGIGPKPLRPSESYSRLSSCDSQKGARLQYHSQVVLGDRKSASKPTTAFCQPEVKSSLNLHLRSFPSKTMAGGPNPKTLIPPVIPPRSHDLDEWRTNETVQHSSINSAPLLYECEHPEPRDYCAKPKEDSRKRPSGVPLCSPFGFGNPPKDSCVNVDGGIHDVIEPFEHAEHVEHFSFPDKTFPPREPIRASEPKYHNVYDPRFYSYGPSDRSYIDSTTEQPRFAYDDVNAVRRQQYISRSKVDSFIDTQDKNLCDIRDEVNQHWHDTISDHRDDMMERLMRKRNGEMWQLRQAPLRR